MPNTADIAEVNGLTGAVAIGKHAAEKLTLDNFKWSAIAVMGALCGSHRVGLVGQALVDSISGRDANYILMLSCLNSLATLEQVLEIFMK